MGNEPPVHGRPSNDHAGRSKAVTCRARGQCADLGAPGQI